MSPVCTIAHWPAVIPAGAVSEQHCLTMDWSATMPAIPEVATISLGYSYKDMPQR